MGTKVTAVSESFKEDPVKVGEVASAEGLRTLTSFTASATQSLAVLA